MFVNQKFLNVKKYTELLHIQIHIFLLWEKIKSIVFLSNCLFYRIGRLPVITISCPYVCVCAQTCMWVCVILKSLKSWNT